jgi:Bacterial regulatory protein, Fis family
VEKMNTPTALRTLAQAERDLIAEHLEYHNYFLGPACKTLGLSRKCVYIKILKYVEDGDKFFIEAKKMWLNKNDKIRGQLEGNELWRRYPDK